MEQVSGFYFPLSGQTSSGFSEMEEISVSGFNILVRAKRDGKWWVLKALAPDVRHNEVFRNLLHKEYDILSKIQHPGVVYVEGIEEVDGYGECLVQEWIDGVTLDEWLQKPHSRSQRQQVAHQLLEVMEYVHSQQVVHRDLKLSNIMVTRSGSVVKVIDFGLSDADYYAILNRLRAPRDTSRQNSSRVVPPMCETTSTVWASFWISCSSACLVAFPSGTVFVPSKGVILM